ncbi:MAG: cytidylate kinase-like family protein [Candidatus Baltobacteraceae bacterium]
MIVTVSNQYGSGAIAVARMAAERLGYALVDEALPVVVARRLQTSVEAVESAEDTSRTMSERLLAGLEMATPEVSGVEAPSFDEQCFREVQAAVREYAAIGNTILIGRGANAILGRRQDVVRVFMHAPREWRIHHIMRLLAADERVAAGEVDRIDKARARYMRRYYDLDWGDPSHYDLSLDAATFGESGCAALIVRAVQADA